MAQGKAHIPTDETRTKVREYATTGVAQHRIAAAIGISEPTLTKYYRTELDDCAGLFEAKLEQALCSRALLPDCPPAVLIFASKVRLSYRELTPKDPDRKTLDEVSDDELAAMVGARARERRQDRTGGAGDPEAETRAA